MCYSSIPFIWGFRLTKNIWGKSPNHAQRLRNKYTVFTICDIVALRSLSPIFMIGELQTCSWSRKKKIWRRFHCQYLGLCEDSKKGKILYLKPPAGLEPAISGLGGRCLIHWATEAIYN